MGDKLKYKNKYRIDSNRCKNWNYASPGYYFVTLCTHERKNIFGKIIEERMNLSEIGDCVTKYWLEIPKHFPNVKLGDFVVMPNHVHGIIQIVETNNHSSLHHATTKSPKQNGTSKTLGSIIRGFKIAVTRWSRTNTDIWSVWQSNYYDRIIRNESELNNIREYIRNNPIKWGLDGKDE